MILLDTNVVSELMAPEPLGPVLDWVNNCQTATLFISAISLAEISYGLEIIPDGRRRQALEQQFTGFIAKGFGERVLAFDAAAARHYGPVMARRRRLGRPIATLDGQIAAIALAQGSTVATRNIRDFADCGLELVNPFEKV